MAKISRKKKKALKKSAGLQGQKVSSAELNDLRQKQIEKNKRDNYTRKRYNENKQYLREQGVPENIISKSVTKKETIRRAEEWQKQQKAAKAKAQREARYSEKVESLIKAGYTPEQAAEMVGSPGKQKSWDAINQMTGGFRQTGENYLYIGVADYDGFSVPDLSGMSVSDLQDQIQEIYEESLSDPDGYSRMRGFFKAYAGKKEDCEVMAKEYFKHGYNLDAIAMKLDNRSYSKLTISNSFSRREFLEMVYTCISQARNDHTIILMSDFKEFCRMNEWDYLSF